MDLGSVVISTFQGVENYFWALTKIIQVLVARKNQAELPLHGIQICVPKTHKPPRRIEKDKFPYPKQAHNHVVPLKRKPVARNTSGFPYAQLTRTAKGAVSSPASTVTSSTLSQHNEKRT